MFATILLDKSDDIATITLNRPDRLNAWTDQMAVELTQAITDCNEDPNVGAMVVTGAGRGFCAGADIKDNFKTRIDTAEATERPARAESRGDWIELIRTSKPIVAAINGACIGVGATMVLPMDVLIASDRAKFAMAFVKMGVTPELASSHFLVQRMGIGRASEMALSGRLYSGEEALAAGLIDRLVPHDELVATAQALAREIAANPAPHLLWVKELLTANGSETDLKTVQRRELEVLTQAFATDEHKEAVSAFIEKRPPQFKR